MTPKELSKDDLEILEYFWNPRLMEVHRSGLNHHIISSIEFLLFTGRTTNENDQVILRVSDAFTNLLKNDYIKPVSNQEKGQRICELDQKGFLYFDDKYGGLKRKLKKLIDTTPLWLTLLSVTVGTIGGIASLIMIFLQIIGLFNK